MPFLGLVFVIRILYNDEVHFGHPIQEHDVKISIEIRAAEGGDDARLLVIDQAGLYLNYAKRSGGL